MDGRGFRRRKGTLQPLRRIDRPQSAVAVWLTEPLQMYIRRDFPVFGADDTGQLSSFTHGAATRCTRRAIR
jgi:hypothetical protein